MQKVLHQVIQISYKLEHVLISKFGFSKGFSYLVKSYWTHTYLYDTKTSSFSIFCKYFYNLMLSLSE